MFDTNCFNTSLKFILNLFEFLIMSFVHLFIRCLKVKVIRDDKGVPFLYRYHILMLTKNGPGICIHRFVKSDPDRGFHDHPWSYACSWILSGEYKERILITDGMSKKQIRDHVFNMSNYQSFTRSRFHINCLHGKNAFHRVMIDPGKEAWTIFFFTRRSKTWGMIDLNGHFHDMSVQVDDTDGGWWNDPTTKTGLELVKRTPLQGNVVGTVDTLVHVGTKILLIKRGKDPYKEYWALPGGRIEQVDSNLCEAAKRELLEETNLELDIHDTDLVKIVGNNTRDPRGFCLTCVFKKSLDKIPENIRAGDDAVNYGWFDITELPNIAFDHLDIIQELIANTKKHEEQNHEEQNHEEQNHKEQNHKEQNHEEQNHEEQNHEKQNHEKQKDEEQNEQEFPLGLPIDN